MHDLFVLFRQQAAYSSTFAVAVCEDEFSFWSVAVWLNSLIEEIFYFSSYFKQMKYLKSSHLVFLNLWY